MCNKSVWFSLELAAGKNGSAWKSAWGVLILKPLFCELWAKESWWFTGPLQPPVLGKSGITAQCSGDYVRYSGNALWAPLKLQIFGCLKESVNLRVEPTDQVRESFPSAAQVKLKQTMWTSPPDHSSKSVLYSLALAPTWATAPLPSSGCFQSFPTNSL